jgi:hypothetical protein
MARAEVLRHSSTLMGGMIIFDPTHFLIQEINITENSLRSYSIMSKKIGFDRLTTRSMSDVREEY